MKRLGHSGQANFFSPSLKKKKKKDKLAKKQSEQS
jgi:hypothetical protein